MNQLESLQGRQNWRTPKVVVGCVILLSTVFYLRNRTLTPESRPLTRRESLWYLSSHHAGVTNTSWSRVCDIETAEALFFWANPEPYDAELMQMILRCKKLRVFGVLDPRKIGHSTRSGRQFRDEQLNQLLQLDRLEEVYLDSTLVTDAGLLQCAAHPRIQYICVAGTRVTDKGISAFKKLRPDCQIITALPGEYDRYHGTYHMRLRWHAQPDGNELAHAVSLPFLKEIRYSNGGNRIPISDDDLQIVASLPDLEILDLRTTQSLTDKSIDHLIGHPSLKQVCLGSSWMLTHKGKQRLIESYQDLGREFKFGCRR